MNNTQSSGLILVEVDQALKPLTEYIATGNDVYLDKQLVNKSLQSHILEHTPNDSNKRFADISSLHDWQTTKNRELHWLLGPDKDLAGIIWYGALQFPLESKLHDIPSETFAIRIYEGYVGHGLAKPFMKQSLRIHIERKLLSNHKVSGIWLETDVDNEVAIASYLKFGYHEVHRDDTRVTMMMTSAQILETIRS